MSPVISDRLPDQDVDQDVEKNLDQEANLDPEISKESDPATEKLRADQAWLLERIKGLVQENLTRDLRKRAKTELQAVGMNESFVDLLDLTNEERFNEQIGRLKRRHR